jgi:hypothetical protein
MITERLPQAAGWGLVDPPAASYRPDPDPGVPEW